MATLTVGLTLSSSDDSADVLSLSLSDSLTVGAPSIGVSRVSVATTGQENILTTAGNTGISYVYVRNTDTTNIIVLKADDGTAVMDLSPGEFAFLPLKGGVGLEATADTAACVLEYAYWSKS